MVTIGLSDWQRHSSLCCYLPLADHRHKTVKLTPAGQSFANGLLTRIEQVGLPSITEMTNAEQHALVFLATHSYENICNGAVQV